MTHVSDPRSRFWSALAYGRQILAMVSWTSAELSPSSRKCHTVLVCTATLYPVVLTHSHTLSLPLASSTSPTRHSNHCYTHVTVFWTSNQPRILKWDGSGADDFLLLVFDILNLRVRSVCCPICSYQLFLKVSDLPSRNSVVVRLKRNNSGSLTLSGYPILQRARDIIRDALVNPIL